ncbi:MAG: LCP family protein [Oscillospiraceae bacterium]|nr:LCP family protein [Oscillospiraceae bacterium]MDD4413854.1 LCP family protein [Oscillospiraceae bacterium]
MPLYRDKRRKQRKKKINNIMVFLLAFVLFLVVFGGICLWAVIKINEARQTSEPSSVVSSDEPSFGPEDARTLLIVTTYKGESQGFVAVRANPEKSAVHTLAFPRDTVVDYKTSEIRLHELTDRHGIVVARDALSTLTGISFDNYMVITYDNIEKLITHFESGVIMNINEDLNYRDQDMVVDLDSGLRTLSAAQAVNVLRYPSWNGGRKQQADIQAQMTAALINQYMKASRENKADDDFSFIVNLAAKTDILVPHYKNAKQGLSYLAENNDGNLCKSVSFAGGYQGSGKEIRYYAADNIKVSLKSIFD